MIEAKLTIECPDLVAAATMLAKAIGACQHAEPTHTTAMPQNHVSTPAPSVPAVGQTPPAVPQTASPTAPITEPPKYSIDDIARAGAELAQQGPDKITALTGLLQQFDLQAVTQLRQDQMGPFVMALRGLGARI